MYAYHYWKCYHKEGGTFQTASLYSVEVDYYNYGTCEITGGSYFCGDHSCNTFKHVAKDAVGGTVMEHNQPFWVSASSSVYTDGTQNLNGNRDSAHTIVNNPRVNTGYYQQQFGSTGATPPSLGGTNDGTWGSIGFPLRADQSLPAYHIHDGQKYNAAYFTHANYAAGLIPYPPNVVNWHARETLVLGQCKAKCDTDETCKGFQENRWQYLHTSIKCHTFHTTSWFREFPTALTAGLLTEPHWDFYEKYTNAKGPTWLHVPTTGSHFSPTTSGPVGRRLAGVY